MRRVLALALLVLAVPAPLRAQAGQAMAARALPRGHVLGPEDVTGAGELPVGWITRRVIRAGEPLRPPAIGRAPVVRAGGSVAAIAGQGRVRVVRRAIAVADGAAGDTILVRVPRQPAIPAVVVDSGTVTLLPPSLP